MELINYDIEKLKGAISDFYNSTGVNINFLKEDFTSMANIGPWTEGYCNIIQQNDEGRNRCMRSDRVILEKCRKTKKAEVHVCHAGLVDVAAPVVYNGDVIAYLILGQMKKEEDFSSVEKYVADLELDIDALKENYDKMTVYDEQRFKSIANLATMLTKYIMLESMLRPGAYECLENVLLYIDENYDRKMSVESISKNTNVSKTSLYKYIRKQFNCTLGEYINRVRVEKSFELLKNTDYSVEIISQKVGFLSASYYTRVFKANTGCTPHKYRYQAQSV
ncbi:MAG: PocR ligand-binding domain-containing protein [Clostridia bacterium]|nr:PocR ligand-binding domain-containing protein [Clostridia bacterium]